MKKKLLPILITTILLTSCASREKIAYYQNIDNTEIAHAKFETRVTYADLLMTTVSARNPVAVQPANLTPSLSGDPSNPAGGGQMQQRRHPGDATGFMDCPVAG